MAVTALQTRMERLFKEGFSALDIAEPLLSFDSDVSVESVRSHMATHNATVAGVRSCGVVVGYVAFHDLRGGTCGSCVRSFRPDETLTDASSLYEVVPILDKPAYCFVSVLGNVSAYITRKDFQKPPARMWLFGLVTIIEMFVTRMVREKYPNDSWRPLMPERLVDKAMMLQTERRRRDEVVDLVDCLQLEDKMQILLNYPQTMAEAGLGSLREGREMMKEIESLRNKLADAMDIANTNWKGIVLIARRLEKIMTRV